LLLQRASRQVIRDFSTNVARVVISSLLALVVSSVYGSKDGMKLGSEMSVSDKVNIIAQAGINVAMLSMIKTLQLLKKEKVVVSRERTQGQYSSFVYLLSKTMAELPFDSAVAAVFGALLHFHSKMKGDRLTFTAVLCLLGCASSSLGLAIGALFPQGDVAVAIGQNNESSVVFTFFFPCCNNTSLFVCLSFRVFKQVLH
jgi:ABC-2 type transporter